MSIRAIRSDTEHLPCVIEVKANAAFSCGSFGGYEESCTCGSLRVKEPYGGGEALIVEPLTFDARGNGGGRIVNTITGDHESTISDYTAVVLEPTVVERLDNAEIL